MKIKDVHPLADLFPMLSKPELAALADDIKANGLRESIKVTKDGTLVEGRNRLAACKIADVEPRYEEVNGDAGDLILSANIFRRHMTKGQIAILAVTAETGITLPASDDVNNTQPSRIEYGIGSRAHSRVEKLVSKRTIEDAVQITHWRPDLARLILETGEGWVQATYAAEQAKSETASEETRIKTMQEDSSDLLELVKLEKISLAEAWGMREDRMRQARETRIRLTGYLVDYIQPLLGKSEHSAKELVEHYEPNHAKREIGIAELDEAITYLRSLKAEFKRQRKG